MSRKIYHVTYDVSKDEWRGMAEHDEHASVVCENKSDVEQQMIDIARIHGHSQVVIHDVNGKIQSQRTYGENHNHPTD